MEHIFRITYSEMGFFSPKHDMEMKICSKAITQIRERNLH